MRRTVLLSLVAATVFVTGACQVRTDVMIDVAPDGSGMVEVRVALDRDAARRLGDPAAVQLDDLRLAGWAIDDPASAEDGSVTFRGRRAFSGPDQLGAVLAEVGGDDGVFGEVELTVTDGFGSADYEFSADVSLSGTPEQFSDAELAAALEGLPLARSPEELTAVGADDPDAATLTVSVALPGGAPRTAGSVEDGRATWTLPMTGGVPTDEQLRVTSTTSRGRTGLLVGVAVVAGIGALGAGVTALVRRRT